MNEEWLARVIHHLRAIGNDTQQYEVKEAKGALPKSIVETLSAFSNAQGGFVILGISEKNGFVPVEGFDARKMQDARRPLFCMRKADARCEAGYPSDSL